MATAGPKRSLFSRPAWATSKTSNDAASEEGSIFGRTAVYEEVLEADRQQRERREAKLKAKAQDYASKENGVERRIKRRRISDEDDENVADSSDDHTFQRGNSYASSDNSDEGPIQNGVPDAQRRKKSSLIEQQISIPQNKSPAKPPTAPKDVITLDDDDEDHISKKRHRRAQDTQEQSSQLSQSTPPEPYIDPISQKSESDEEEDDEYLRELKQKARQKKLIQRPDTEIRANRTATQVADSDKQLSSESLSEESRQLTQRGSRALDSARPQNAIEDDPVVHIRVVSIIPNTEELIVKRLASQPMQHVRDYWCMKQGFEESFASRVFFTWRGTRIFNSTTSRSIINRLRKENKDADGQDPSGGRIEVEAITQEISDLRQKQRERRMMEEAGLNVDEKGRKDLGSDEDEDKMNKQFSPDRSEPNINNGPGGSKRTKDDSVIRLVCQGYEPVIMRVRPDSKISKVMTAFQRARGIHPEKTCWLVFDGERLDPDATIKEIGLEDEDNIEVYLR